MLVCHLQEDTQFVSKEILARLESEMELFVREHCCWLSFSDDKCTCHQRRIHEGKRLEIEAVYHYFLELKCHL